MVWIFILWECFFLIPLFFVSQKTKTKTKLEAPSAHGSFSQNSERKLEISPLVGTMGCGYFSVKKWSVSVDATITHLDCWQPGLITLAGKLAVSQIAEGKTWALSLLCYAPVYQLLNDPTLWHLFVLLTSLFGWLCFGWGGVIEF